MNITVSIYRSVSHGRGALVDYTIPLYQGMTVLDVLMYVYKNLDATLAFRYECRQGICGTCGVMLNNVPVLSCSTQVDPKRKNTIAPLSNFPVEKDLIVDIAPVLKRFMKVKPYLEKAREVMLTKNDADRSKPFRKCIECGCCIAGSPTARKLKNTVLDPMALVKIARFVTDPRDGGSRRAIALRGGVGVYGLSEAKKLTALCPRGIPIDKAINLLK